MSAHYLYFLYMDKKGNLCTHTTITNFELGWQVREVYQKLRRKIIGGGWGDMDKFAKENCDLNYFAVLYGLNLRAIYAPFMKVNKRQTTRNVFRNSKIEQNLRG